MKRMIPVVLAVLASAGMAAAASETVGGKVFADANGNGVMDPGEKGLAGVRVTDGLSFATTGADGSYSIAVGADPVIRYRGAHRSTLLLCRRRADQAGADIARRLFIHGLHVMPAPSADDQSLQYTWAISCDTLRPLP